MPGSPPPPTCIAEWKQQFFLETRVGVSYWIVPRAANELPCEEHQTLVDHTTIRLPPEIDPEQFWIVDSTFPTWKLPKGAVEVRMPAVNQITQRQTSQPHGSQECVRAGLSEAHNVPPAGAGAHLDGLSEEPAPAPSSARASQ